MPEIPDSEFEKLFRKSAQKLNPEFNPEAWDKMEKLLDKEDRKAFWWRTGIILLLLFLVGLGGTLLYKYNSDDLNLNVDNQENTIIAEKSSRNEEFVNSNGKKSTKREWK